MTNNTSKKSEADLPLWLRIFFSLIIGIMTGCLVLFLGQIFSSEEKNSNKQPIYVNVAIGLGIVTFFYSTVIEIMHEVKPKPPITQPPVTQPR